MKKNIFIIVIISISISVTLVSTWLSYRNAVRSSEDFLKAQALVIATSLENTIIKYGTNENIFSDIITGGRWQGIAFLALYDTGGLTILHSNRNLINKRIDRRLIQKTADTGDIQYSRTALGTGETVFLLDLPVQAKGSMMVLRVALHTYPSLGTVRQERLHLLSILVIILILSIITTFFLILSKKRQELERTLVEKEKLSVIGEMASVLAHEIRNPLGSIKGFAQYLKEQFTGRRQPDKGLSEKYIDVIVTES
ncbi:MAG: histidine kinase dimerization/phospho-acceptor domain-containing protein, partial [Nitrospirota bacterium]